MRITLCLLLLLNILLLNSAYSSAQSSTAADVAEREVLALENARNQAISRGDSKSLEPLLNDGFIYIDYDGGLMDRGQYLAHIKAMSSSAEHIVSESMRAHTYGKNILVTGVYRENGLNSGHPYTFKARFVDAWIERKGAWVCVSSQSTLISH